MVHTSHYWRLETPTIPLATRERLQYHVYIARSIYHYAYARQTQVNWKKETMKRKEGKERRACCCVAVENRLEDLCLVRSPGTTRAWRATNPRPTGLVALDLAESRQSYVRGIELSREPRNR